MKLWTLRRNALLIEEMLSVSITPSSVMRFLGRIGLSVQRLSGVARELNEVAIRTWEAKSYAP